MLITILIFLVVLVLLVLVHEFGHFVAAKISGVKVEEFGFGFPPRLIGWYKDSQTKKWKRVGITQKSSSGTIYSLNMLPLGGFVKLKGELMTDIDDEESFAKQTFWKKFTILSAGVGMNIVLAAVLFSIGFMIGVPWEIDENVDTRAATIRDRHIAITHVIKDFPAEQAGIQPGDKLINIDGKEFSSIQEIQQYIHEHRSNEMTLKLQREERETIVTLRPIISEEIQRGVIGVGLTEVGIISYPWYRAIFEGWKMTLFILKKIILALYELFKNLIVEKTVSAELSGPVGIAVLTGEVARLGFIYLLQFTALLSLNLAVINFLPFPALDGGRVLFILIEKIRGKAVDARIEALIHNIGLSLLLVLVFVISYRDILRFSDTFARLWDSIKSIF